MKVRFTEEQNSRLIEILEDEIHRQVKRYSKLCGLDRIEQARIDELKELIAVLRSAQ